MAPAPKAGYPASVAASGRVVRAAVMPFGRPILKQLGQASISYARPPLKLPRESIGDEAMRQRIGLPARIGVVDRDARHV